MSSDTGGDRREMVEVEILGETYTLRSETTADYTRRVAEHVDRTAREIQEESGTMDHRRLAILTALAVTDQMFRVRDGFDRARTRLETRAERITAEILSVVGEERDT